MSTSAACRRIPLLHPPSPHSRLVLVVESDAGVRHLVGRMLERLGFTAVLAPGCESALGLWSELGDRIGLVVAQIDGPGAACPRTMATMLRARPHLSIVCVLGSPSSERREQVDALRAGILTKPFTAEELARSIGVALAAQATPRRAKVVTALRAG